MDGGGRYLQPMTAYPADIVVARAASEGRRPVPSSRRSFGSPRGVRPGRSVAVPLERRVPRFLGTWLVLGFFTAVTGFGLVAGGHMDAFVKANGQPHHAMARALGLGLDQVTISGISRIRESEVLDAAGLNGKVSLPFIDVSDVRERLERVPLIKSASVRKLYPNELVITLTEREPHAIWQHNGELFIIAADGTVMDLMQDERFAELPMVVGEKANLRSKDYLALLEAAGPLKSRIRAGTLVSGRRWTLKLDNGIDVRLPETGAAEAMARLVKLEKDQRILEKDVLAIDLRMADRVVLRLTEEAALARAEALKKKPMRGRGVDT